LAAPTPHMPKQKDSPDERNCPFVKTQGKPSPVRRCPRSIPVATPPRPALPTPVLLHPVATPRCTPRPFRSRFPTSAGQSASRQPIRPETQQSVSDRDSIPGSPHLPPLSTSEGCAATLPPDCALLRLVRHAPATPDRPQQPNTALRTARSEPR